MSTRLYRFLSACLLVAILVATLMTGSAKSALLAGHAHVWLEKLGHGLGFFSLAFCAVRARCAGFGRARVVVAAALLAGLTEFLQQFIPGRTPLLSDALIDATGALLGACIPDPQRVS